MSALSSEERVFALSQRQAQALATSDLAPKAFAGNVANCLIAVNLAKRTQFDPLMVMQNMAVIHGKPSWSATFLIACINACGRFESLQFRIEGEGMKKSCTATAVEKSTGEVVEGPPVTMQMARDEGWSEKAGSKWKTMPDLMLRYRSAAFFARTVAPEIAMGMHTPEEAIDMRANSQARHQPSASSAQEALEQARDVTPPEPELEQIRRNVLDEIDSAFSLAGDGPADI
jgi:hypothetical protein